MSILSKRLAPPGGFQGSSQGARTCPRSCRRRLGPGRPSWRSAPGQVLQPGSSGVGEEQGEVADDEIIIVRSTQLAGQRIVHEPQFRSHLPRVLCDSSWGSEPGRERCPSYGAAERLQTEWFGRGTLILPAVVASLKGKCALGPFLSILVIEC